MIASDHAAFQKAIAADPADLTGRMVYADFLEETGEPPHVARAEFIRTQIEADALPPGDPRRPELLGRADVLFTEHWLDWWTPVCRAVGLRLPYVPGTALRERIARALGTNKPLGWPYSAAGQGTVVVQGSSPGKFELTDRLHRAWFRRGCLEGLALIGALAGWARPIRRWAATFPLRSLQLSGIFVQDWAAIDGDHLRHVTELALVACPAEPVRAVLASPHLDLVTDLSLVPDATHPGWAEDQLQAVLASPVAPGLASLEVSLPGQSAAGVLAESRRLTRLTRLTVLPGTPDDGAAGVIGVLAGAAVVGQLEGLRVKFTTHDPVTGHPHRFYPTVEEAILRLLDALDPKRLRHLDLDATAMILPRITERIAARFGDRTWG